MDGIHDLGGKHGFGEVVREAKEPAFHERWEAVVFALSGAVGAAGAMRNVDQFRHAVERIDPVAYLDHGYYGRWLGGIENLLVEAGLLTQREIDDRVQRSGGTVGRVAARPSSASDRVDYAPEGSGAQRPLSTAPKFNVGDAVVTQDAPCAGHTRLPAYARGKRGEVTAWHGGWVFPDANAHGQGERPAHLYTISFPGRALWGAGAEPATTVSLDLFEPYLKKVAQL